MTPFWRSPRFRALTEGGVVLCAVAAATRFAQVRLDPANTGTDDANIVFRYASNLLAGQGLVWNAGGPKVEGYSSPLWLFMTVAVSWCPKFERVLRLFAVITVASALYGWVNILTRSARATVVHRVSPLAFICVAWLLASPAYIVWSTVSLLETGTWGALLLASVVLGVDVIVGSNPSGRTLSLWSVSLCLLTITRPEGTIFAPLVLLLVALRVHAVHRSSAARKHVWTTAATLGFVEAALFVSRRLYFGFWLPNTYYCKIGSDSAYHAHQGLEFLRQFAMANPVVWIIGPALLWSAGSWFLAAVRPGPCELCVDTLFESAGLASIMIVVGVVVTLLEGGDHFAGWRPIQPFWPFCLAPAALASRAMAKRGSEPSPRFPPWLLITVVAAIALTTSSVKWSTLEGADTNFAIEFELARRGRAAGGHLNSIFHGEPMPTVAVIAAGGIGFAYHGPVLDLMGVNDARMAHATRARYGLHGHSAFSSSVFYEESPDLIVASGRECAALQPEIRLVDDWAGTLLNQIAIEPRFRAAYVPVVLPYSIVDTPGKALCEWAKRSLLTDPRVTVGVLSIEL